MPYIYRYLDKNDETYKYVGISQSRKGLKRRIYAHKSDSWFGNGDWTIEYAFVESITDLEMLEGHFISELKTYLWYNKAKSKWGKSRLFNIPELDWSEYTTKTFLVDRCDNIEVLREMATDQSNELHLLKRAVKLEKLRNKELNRLLKGTEAELQCVKGDKALLEAKVESLLIENKSLDEERKSIVKDFTQERRGVDYKETEITDLSRKTRRAYGHEVCKLFEEDFFDKVTRGDVNISKIGDKRQQDAFMNGVGYACENLRKIFSHHCYT